MARSFGATAFRCATRRAGSAASCTASTAATTTARWQELVYYAQRDMTLADAYDYASGVMVDNMMAQDAAEGIGAFIEKRAPQWQDA